MKKLGKVNLTKHMIGDRKPIIAFLGFSMLSGCGFVGNSDYTMFNKLSTCVDYMGKELCAVRYQDALAEAKRTAMKYQSERDCQQDYGNICMEWDNMWLPNVAGFVAHQQSSFVMPFFTSTKPESSHFGYAFAADGAVLGKYRDVDGKSLSLDKKYTKPLPTSSLDIETTEVGIPQVNNATDNSYSNNNSGNSMLSNVATYIIAQTLYDANYRADCSRYQRNDCYNVSSGTGHISTGTISSSSTTGKPKLSDRQIDSYNNTMKTTTISRGGFGNTGSVRGGFGG